MSKKAVDPNDEYVVRELFACGAGHFLTPGFTHWESGECCPHDHAPGEDPHLYYRNILVPKRRSKRQGGGNMWKWMLKNPGMWGHLPVTP